MTAEAIVSIVLLSSGMFGGVRSVTLLRFGLPGQLVSINGSDIGTIGELEVSVTDFCVENDVGGIGGVRFLDTDLIMSGDESTLAVALVGAVITAFAQDILASAADILTGPVVGAAKVGELLLSTGLFI